MNKNDRWELYFGTLVLGLYCYWKKKYGLISNHLFQRKSEHGGWDEPQRNNKLF